MRAVFRLIVVLFFLGGGGAAMTSSTPSSPPPPPPSPSPPPPPPPSPPPPPQPPAESTVVNATVFYNNKTQAYSVVAGINHSGLAWGTYSKSLNQTGWNTLNLIGNYANTSIEVAYALGYLEAYLTHEDVWSMWQNTVAVMYDSSINGSLPTYVNSFITLNSGWTQENIAANPKSNFWSAVNGVTLQLQGLVDGYSEFKAASSGSLSYNDLASLSAMSDVQTIVQEATGKVGARSASAFVKVTDDLSELYAGHATWASYSNMLRVYKAYSFNVAGSPYRVTFSSYPGVLSSCDDFYQTSFGLVAIRSGNAFFNSTLLHSIEPRRGVLTWVKAMAANQIAHTGEAWVKVFNTTNVGTSPSQWLIINYNSFTPGQDLLPGTLWIFETTPGVLRAGDVTTVLSLGYWAAYGLPFYPAVYGASGLEPLRSSSEPAAYTYDYERCPRANIFRRNSTDVTSATSAVALLSYNNFAHDTLSMGEAVNAIAGRSDLASLPPSSFFSTVFERKCEGAIDAKVTSHKLMPMLSATVRAGPTSFQQPVFVWDEWTSGNGEPSPHIGLPPSYDFPTFVLEIPLV